MTIERELTKLAARTKPDVLAVTDASGTVLAVAGRRSNDWPMNRRLSERVEKNGAKWVVLPSGVFQFSRVSADAAGHRDRDTAAGQGTRPPLCGRDCGALRRSDSHRLERHGDRVDAAAEL